MSCFGRYTEWKWSKDRWFELGGFWNAAIYKRQQGLMAIIPPDDCVEFEQYCVKNRVRYEMIGSESDGMHIRIGYQDLGKYLWFWKVNAS